MGESRIRLAPWTTSLVALLALAFAGCADGPSGAGGSSAAFAPFSGSGGGVGDGARAGGADDAPSRRGGSGAEIRVTWEALAVEQDRFENPQLSVQRRRSMRGVVQTQKIVLVSESHPEAEGNRVGRTAVENAGVAVAPLADDEMLAFMRGVEQQGFFRMAQPTGTVAYLFQNPNARGRITVERGGESWSLVSMRGQGLNDSTKEIPRLYSELKRAILVLRNQTPTLSVIGLERSPLR